MLETFTVDTFKPHLGKPFRVIVDDTHEMITLLSEVSPWGHEEAASRPRTVRTCGHQNVMHRGYTNHDPRFTDHRFSWPVS